MLFLRRYNIQVGFNGSKYFCIYINIESLILQRVCPVSKSINAISLHSKIHWNIYERSRKYITNNAVFTATPNNYSSHRRWIPLRKICTSQYHRRCSYRIIQFKERKKNPRPLEKNNNERSAQQNISYLNRSFYL